MKWFQMKINWAMKDWPKGHKIVHHGRILAQIHLFLNAGWFKIRFKFDFSN